MLDYATAFHGSSNKLAALAVYHVVKRAYWSAGPTAWDDVLRELQDALIDHQDVVDDDFDFDAIEAAIAGLQVIIAEKDAKL